MDLKAWWGKLDKYSKLAFIIILAGIFLRFFISFFVYVTGDPCWVVSVSRYIAENYKIPLFEPLGRPVFWAPPLFHLIIAFFYKLFGVFSKDIANFSVRLVAPVFGSLTLLYGFFLAKKIYNSKIAFYSVIFLAFIPLHIYMSVIPYQDIALAFFVLASVYYLLDKRAFLSGVFAGLAISTKYTAVFIFPLSFFIIFLKFSKDKKEICRIIFLFLAASFLFGSWWYLRNYFILGNIFWPHLNSILLHDTGVHVDPNFIIQDKFEPDISRLFKLDFAYKNYLSLYGVPGEGDIENLTFFKLPFLNAALLLWLAGTLFFSIPLFIYLIKIKLKDKRNWILLIWFSSFFFYVIMNKITNNFVYLRQAMPLIIPLAIMWGLGMETIFSINKKAIKTALSAVFIFCILGFAGIEIVKAAAVSNMWSKYSEDFKWVEKNIPANSIILVPSGDCYAYNFNKYTYGHEDSPNINSAKEIKKYGISHIWINQKIDFYGSGKVKNSGAYSEDFLKAIENNTLIYYNEKTSTKVYKVK